MDEKEKIDVAIDSDTTPITPATEIVDNVPAEESLVESKELSTTNDSTRKSEADTNSNLITTENNVNKLVPQIAPQVQSAKVSFGSEATMFLARLGCILNNYNIALVIIVPMLFLATLFYGLAMAFNYLLAVVALIFAAICTLGIILLEPGPGEFVNSLMLFKPDTAGTMGDFVFEYILPNSIAIFIACSISSLVLHIIGRKHTSILRIVWSIICIIISLLFLALYFINKGGLSA